MKKDIIISAKDITIGYPKSKRKDKTALYESLSFDLHMGELVCLLGANGAGKSTLLRTISHSQATLKGKIILNNKDIDSYSEKDLSRLLGLVLTDKTAVGGLLVKELVELGRYPYTGFFGQLTKQDKDIVLQAMIDTGIDHKANNYVAELSDGERQKAMISKALAQECPIVLLDEPTAFLDIESRIEVMNLLHNLTRKGKTILLSTHDVDMALLLADRLWLLSQDKGLLEGVTEDIIISGKIDYFFNENKILFDKKSGNFLPKRSGSKLVLLQSEGDLYHWTKNILERNDLSVTDKNSNEEYLLKITATSMPSLSFVIEMKNKENIKLNSFRQLADFLRNSD